MEAIIFVSVLVVVMVVILRKKLDKKKKRLNYLNKKGHSPEKPWIITNQDKMTQYIQNTRCHCGGKFYKRSKTTLVDNASIIVVGGECVRCEEKIRLYFRIEYLN